MVNGLEMSNSPEEQPIHVTKSFLPPREDFDSYIDQIWENVQLTNEGPLSKRFTSKVSEYLHIKEQNFVYVNNGTLALQLALRELVGDIDGAEIITTPFTYVATTSAIMWEKYTPVYVDINPETLTIDASKIEAAITSRTKAILAVHVYGNVCDIEAIDTIAKKHNLYVIYDAAHAFGVEYKGESVLKYGDASTLSFHATKLMHTIEGGAIYTNSAHAEGIDLLKRFGHNGDEHIQLGINAKPNEFQAAMGLVNLEYIDGNIAKRKKVFEKYNLILSEKNIQLPKWNSGASRNYSYYAIILESETERENVISRMNQHNIFPRKYFSPSLNTLPYLENTASCPVSEDIANRILCLPLYADLEEEKIIKICNQIN